ncbi:ATP-binding protein [Streptomyces sp. NPDC049813]|uniref:ATP-binding protein n=1 Tax=Streptomyces sp. NPDC049813 TaxID=3365597 RepID=UPI0037A8D3D1
MTPQPPHPPQPPRPPRPGPSRRSLRSLGSRRPSRPRRPRLPAWTASLTWKAAAFLAVICCALAALLGILVHVSVTDQTVREARQRALARLDEATEAFRAGGRLGPGAAVDPAGLPASLRRLAVSGERGTMVGGHDKHPTMWAAGPAAGGKALGVQIDYSQGARTIDGLDQAILGSSALAIGATLLVGAFAVTRVTRRLHTTARVARKISAGDLDARVDDPRTGDPGRHQDEVAAVAGALDSMAASLQSRILTEQRFTADVAHELRTPLTGLHAAAELLPPGRPTELVRDRVAALRTLTEDLLEISRLDARSERVELDDTWLGPVAERVLRASGVGVSTGAAAGTGSSAGAEPASGAGHGSDAGSGSGAGAGHGSDAGSGPGAGAGSGAGHGSDAGSGPSTGADSGFGAGAPPEPGPRATVVVVRDVCVVTDRRRLERVLGNLVANAHRHGGPPVELTVDGPVITVRDHGAGYPDYLVEHGPQRFRTEGGARGHGLGLTIALGQAEILGAELRFSNAPGGGALATLTLPYEDPPA